MINDHVNPFWAAMACFLLFQGGKVSFRPVSGGKGWFRVIPFFSNNVRGHPGPLQYQVPPFKAISQQKVGTKPIHANPNLQTIRPTNFRIRFSFDHYCLGQCHQQNSAAPK